MVYVVWQVAATFHLSVYTSNPSTAGGHANMGRSDGDPVSQSVYDEVPPMLPSYATDRGISRSSPPDHPAHIGGADASRHDLEAESEGAASPWPMTQSSSAPAPMGFRPP
jgi:hypothetical protein